MKRLMVGIAGFSLIFTPPSEAASATEALELGPLSTPLEDAGCMFVPRKADWSAGQIFQSGPDGSWINLNGKEIQLTPVGDPNQWEGQEYSAGDLRVSVKYGRAKQHEAGATLPRAKIILQKNGQIRLIKAKGSCGC